MTTVAIHLVEALVHAGVRRIYGVVGDSLNSIVDAVHHNKKIQWIHVRHEEAGAFAACAEAQLTGSLAVCAGSCGPGNLHLIKWIIRRAQDACSGAGNRGPDPVKRNRYRFLSGDAPGEIVPGLQLLLPACRDGKTYAALVANCHADVYLTRWG